MESDVAVGRSVKQSLVFTLKEKCAERLPGVETRDKFPKKIKLKCNVVLHSKSCNIEQQF